MSNVDIYIVVEGQTEQTFVRDVLAPHGAISLMVYANYGRAPLRRVARAVELLLAPETPLPERIAPAREVATLARRQVLAGRRGEIPSAQRLKTDNLASNITLGDLGEINSPLFRSDRRGAKGQGGLVIELELRVARGL